MMTLSFSQKDFKELVVLYNNGQFEKALVKAKSLIRNNPHDPLIYNILGGINLGLGNLEESVKNYSEVLKFMPDDAEAYNNLGIVLRNLGRIKEALTNFNKAISIKPNIKKFWQNLSTTLKGTNFNLYNEKIANIFLNILNQKTIVRPKQLVNSILSLIKQHPIVKEIIQTSFEKNINRSIEKNCNNLIKIPLFLKLIEICTIPDLEVEKLLTEIRRNLLLNNKQILDKRAILNFQISLALHCFTNEFIFDETEEETLAINQLEEEIKNLIFKKEKIDTYKIACIASYRPLHQYKWLHNLKVPESLKNLFLVQIKDVLKEDLIRSDIKSIRNIKNKTSVSVKKQYEKNPYPRWVNTEINYNPISFLVLIKQLKLKFNNTYHFSKNPEVLVAGCGTGEHAIGVANRYLDCKVLATDLSLSSLSYALRKTNELGIKNIKYIQSDILDLGLLKKQFDIIESAGVLHHMKNPMDGWKALTDCLKPNGFMRIALYSEIARKSIVKARKIISDKKILTTKKEMLKFRQEIINNKFPSLSKIKTFPDFYSTSELRDLLFNVQEHRFTVPQIKTSIYELGLEFSGFEFFNNDIKNKFKKLHPKPETMYSLDAWHEFELLNPDVFVNMYQFWVRKI